MKKSIVVLLVFLLAGTMAFAQNGKAKMEVLYFKANLACCKARACNALEADIQTIVQKNFADSSVIFRPVKLADEVNKALVEKYKAQSQTVIIVKNSKKKEVSLDVSDVVKAYVQNQDKIALETSLLARVNELKKKK